MRHLRRAQRTAEKDLHNVALPAILAALAVALLLGFFPQAASSSAGYHDAVVADNPVGYWRLSENSGTTIVDELGAGHSGSYTGSVTLGQASPITTDSSDTAAYFNGGWGSVPYYSDLDPSGNKLSLEFWWKGAAPSGAQFAVLKGYTSHSDPYYQYGVGAGPSGTVRVVVDTSGSFNPWDTGVSWPGDGAWHQIVVTYDGSLVSNNLKLYIDGAQQAQTNRTGNVRGYSSALGLMDILNLGSGYQTTGRLDEVSVYNSALSASRVSAHFTAATLAAPANTTPPSTSGTAIEGQTVSTDDGSWSGSPTSYAYQWRRCDSAGASCSDISGATSSSYTLVSGDVGSRIRAVVTATNAAGSAAASSAPTAVVLSSSTTASYKQATLADNPVGYWRLSESSGTTIVDELGAGHSGSYTGSVTLGQTSPITTDGSDTAAYFNGGWGSIPYYSDLNPTGNKLSIEFWWKGAAPSGAQFALLKGYTSHSDPYYQYGVGAGPSGTVRVVVDTSGSFSPWDTGVSWPGDGNWHQIVVTYDGSLGSNNLKLYVDGSLQAQTSKTGNVRGYSSALGLMDILNLGSGYQTTGRLDEVSVYNGALSASRVSAHYAAATTAPPVNGTPPAISGSAAVGETLTTDNGSWSGPPTSYSYHWRRCDNSGANCADIAGATSSTYVVVADDIGSTLRAVVLASDAYGSATASSAATPVVPPTEPPGNLDLPSVTGTNSEGWMLTESNGSWTQTPSSYSVQWLRCDDTDGESCVEINGATDRTYATTSEDVDTTIRVRVTATNSLGSASAESPQTDSIDPLTDVGPPDPTSGSPPALTYDGAHITGTRWASTGDGSYTLEFERNNGTWESAIYGCVALEDWPWNTCGNDDESYDGMGGAYSYHKEIWDDFGPDSAAEGTLVQTGSYCGDTGLGEPSENPCFQRRWSPPAVVLNDTGGQYLLDDDNEYHLVPDADTAYEMNQYWCADTNDWCGAPHYAEAADLPMSVGAPLSSCDCEFWVELPNSDLYQYDPSDSEYHLIPDSHTAMADGLQLCGVDWCGVHHDSTLPAAEGTPMPSVDDGTNEDTLGAATSSSKGEKVDRVRKFASVANGARATWTVRPMSAGFPERGDHVGHVLWVGALADNPDDSWVEVGTLAGSQNGDGQDNWEYYTARGIHFKSTDDYQVVELDRPTQKKTRFAAWFTGTKFQVNIDGRRVHAWSGIRGPTIEYDVGYEATCADLCEGAYQDTLHRTYVTQMQSRRVRDRAWVTTDHGDLHTFGSGANGDIKWCHQPLSFIDWLNYGGDTTSCR